MWKLTSRRLLAFGVPQGLNPPEKLGKFRHTIDRMLLKKKEESVSEELSIESVREGKKKNKKD